MMMSIMSFGVRGALVKRSDGGKRCVPDANSNPIFSSSFSSSLRMQYSSSEDGDDGLLGAPIDGTEEGLAAKMQEGSDEGSEEGEGSAEGSILEGGEGNVASEYYASEAISPPRMCHNIIAFAEKIDDNRYTSSDDLSSCYLEARRKVLAEDRINLFMSCDHSGGTWLLPWTKLTPPGYFGVGKERFYMFVTRDSAKNWGRPGHDRRQMPSPHHPGDPADISGWEGPSDVRALEEYAPYMSQSRLWEVQKTSYWPHEEDAFSWETPRVPVANNEADQVSSEDWIGHEIDDEPIHTDRGTYMGDFLQALWRVQRFNDEGRLTLPHYVESTSGESMARGGSRRYSDDEVFLKKLQEIYELGMSGNYSDCPGGYVRAGTGGRRNRWKDSEEASANVYFLELVKLLDLIHRFLDGEIHLMNVSTNMTLEPEIEKKIRQDVSGYIRPENRFDTVEAFCLAVRNRAGI